MHEPKADIDRLYVKRKEEGRGLLQNEVTYTAETMNNAEYLNTKHAEDQTLHADKPIKSINQKRISICISSKVCGKNEPIKKLR